MLERDYILELISQFVEGVSKALRCAAAGDAAGTAGVERQIGELLELDPSTALALAPDSLVTMMVISGMGDSIASYVCYALDRLATLYEREGNEDLAGLRRLQARAIAQSFACEEGDVPPELAALDEELFA